MKPLLTAFASLLSLLSPTPGFPADVIHLKDLAACHRSCPIGCASL
jgi:hypothetical protein